MKTARVLPWALAAATGLAAAAPALAQQAVFLVRHAEKVDESDDPLLSHAGTARAQALARHLASAGVKAIFVTQYKRTGLTAAPLAAKLGLMPVKLPSDASQELAERIRKDHANDVVLVVGHSNSVPRALKLLGHPEPVEIASNEYDTLFVLVPKAAGPPALLRLKY